MSTEGTAGKRALILAGGGVKVAFQAGVLQVWLDETEIDFDHADGASGGVFNLAMWCQGLSGTEIADNWRRHAPLRGLAPNVLGWLTGESMFRLERFRRNVLRRDWRLDWQAIRSTDREASFNLYNFTKHRHEVLDAADMDEDLLLSAVSLPMWFPPVSHHGDTYIDAVFATDANLEEAIRRGADELWVIWTVSERGEWRGHFLAHYFQIIEAAANSNLRAILRRIDENNAAEAQGERGEFGRPIDVKLLRAEVPLHYLVNITQDRMRAAVELGVAAARRWCDLHGISRRHPDELPARTDISPTRVRFTEVMSGYVAYGEEDHHRGARNGRARGDRLRFRLTIEVDDVDRFVADPDHEAAAYGYVSGEAVGGRRQVERGRFQLFVDDADPRDKRMRYQLWLHDYAGHPLTLSGFKVVHDEPGLDLWTDTTTLYTTLVRGHVEFQDQPDAEVVAAGILRITPLQFARQLTTFRAWGTSAGDGARALARFGRLFVGKLWDVYAMPARRSPDPTPQRTDG